MNTHKIGRFRAGILVASVTASMLFPSAIANADELADTAAVAAEAAATTTEAEELPAPEPVAEPAPQPEPQADPEPAPQPEPEPAPQPEPEVAPDPALTGPTDEDTDAPAVEEEPNSVADPDAEEQKSDEPSTKDGEAASLRKSEDDSPSPTLAALIPERVVTGTVRDALGYALPGATVHIQGTGVSASVTAGAGGVFTTSALPVGSYSYTAIYTELVPATGFFTLTASGSAQVDPVLAFYSTLTGTVTDADDGDPASGVGVYVEYPDGRGVSTTTDSAGNWSLDELEPGEVTVRFVGPNGTGYQVEWYRDVATRAAAEVITLQPEGTWRMLNSDIAVSGGLIRGEVQLLNGNAPTQAAINVTDSTGELVFVAHTNSNGEYTTIGLAPDTYTIVATGSNGSQYLRSEPRTVVVSQSLYHYAPTLVLYLDAKEDLPAPVAHDDSYTTPRGTLLQVAAPGVLGNDTPSDPDNSELHVIETVTQPAHGDLLLARDGSFVYSPDDDFAGTDSFTYLVQDYGYSEEPATVTIHVTDEGSVIPLTAVDDAYPASVDMPLTIDSSNGLLSNDTGEGTLRVVGLQGSASANSSFQATTDQGGSVTVSSAGALEYVPAAGFEGVDTFTYLLDDESDADPATGTVRITVGGEVIVCHDPLGNEIPCDQPEVCRDDLGNVIDCEEEPEQPEHDRPRTDTETETETDTSSTTETLAQTGSNANAMIWAAGIAGFLLIDGIVLLVFMRRRALRASANTDIDAA